MQNFKSFSSKNSADENLPSEVFAYADDLLTEKNIAYKTTALMLQTKVNAIKNTIYQTAPFPYQIVFKLEVKCQKKGFLIRILY